MDKSTVNRLRVQLAGQEYTLRGRAPIEHLQTVSELVQRIMNDIRQSSPQLDEKRIAMLTAINVADQFIQLQSEHKELLQLLDQQTTNAGDSKERE